MDFGNTKTPSMHPTLGSATLSQLAFPGEGNPDFLWEKSHWDNTVIMGITFSTLLHCIVGKAMDFFRSKIKHKRLASPNKEIVALDRQETQQQKPESPTVTSPGIGVNVSQYE